MIFFRRLNMNWWNASIYIIKYNNNYILTHAYFLTTYSIIKKIPRENEMHFCLFNFFFFFFIPTKCRYIKRGENLFISLIFLLPLSYSTWRCTWDFNVTLTRPNISNSGPICLKVHLHYSYSDSSLILH